MAFFERFTSRKRPAVEPKPHGGAQKPPAAETFPVAVASRSKAQSAVDLPRFHTTAGDQLDRRLSMAHVKERMRLRDAFTPGQPVMNPHMFSGRTQTLTRMIGALEDQRLHLVVHGQRGVGKTSILHMVSLAAREARYIVVYLSCGAASSFDETFRTAAAEVPLLFHKNVSPTTSETERGTSLADLLPAGTLTPRQFSDVAAKLVGTRVLILLDEFDRAESPTFRRDIAELIKTLSDLSARVQLVIAGVAGDLIELIGHAPSIRRNIYPIEIAPLPEEAVRKQIQNGERESGMAFEEGARRLVVMTSQGSPYLVNLICQLAALHALDDDRVSVSTADVLAASEEAAETFRSRLPLEIVKYVDRTQLGSPKFGPDGAAAHLDAEAVMAQLERDGMVGASDSDFHAFIAEALVPYLQLVSVKQDAAPRSHKTA